MEERRPVESHRDLIAWQRAMELCSATYDATAAFRRLNASAFSPIRRLPLGVRRFGNAENSNQRKALPHARESWKTHDGCVPAVPRHRAWVAQGTRDSDPHRRRIGLAGRDSSRRLSCPCRRGRPDALGPDRRPSRPTQVVRSAPLPLLPSFPPLTTGKHEGSHRGGEEERQRDGVVAQRRPETRSQRDPLVEHVVWSISQWSRG
jgi:hypothetical protein